MNIVRFLVVGSVLSLGSSALSQVSPTAGGAYDFKCKYTKGQKIVYVNSTSVTGQSLKFDLTVTMTCTDVKNGVYSIKCKVDGLPGQKAQDVNLKLNNKGEVVGGDALAKQAMGMGQASLPKKPIKPGETWTSTADTGAASMNMKVTSTYTFKGLKAVNGKQVADISVKISSKGSGMSMTGTGSLYLSAADGNPISMDMSMKMDAGGQKMDMKSTLRRK